MVTLRTVYLLLLLIKCKSVRQHRVSYWKEDLILLPWNNIGVVPQLERRREKQKAREDLGKCCDAQTDLVNNTPLQILCARDYHC